MRVAIIGAGRMGRRHAQVARDLHLELAGICDQNDQALAVVQHEHCLSDRQLFADASALITETRPECVIVATPAPSHCALTCLAAEAGTRYILCEKPMAVSLGECDQMLAACERTGATLAINHQMRFMPSYTEVKRVVWSDAFGGLSSVCIVAPNVGMAMNGTHYFELFRYVTNEPVAEVTAWFSPEKVPNPRGVQFEDRAGSVRLTTASGKRMYIDIGADQGHGSKEIYAGRCGQLLLDQYSGSLAIAVRQEPHRAAPTTQYGVPWQQTVETLGAADAVAPTRAVLDALLCRRDAPSGEDGRRAVAVLVAAYVSDENGHVPVSPDDSALPRDRMFPWA